jgi:2-keto-4-pentenoate hydratase/2-oxohepta-3-ene-1,7-dioic acid hydratase in catechol pathway
LGLVKGDLVFDVTGALYVLGTYAYPLPRHDVLIAALDEMRPRIEAEARRVEGQPLSDVKLLAPVANPGKLVAAPVNYLKHLEEGRSDAGINFGNQVGEIQRVGLFLKATSSVIGPGEKIAIRFPERRNDHEIELAAIIGRRADRVPAAEALQYVAAYTIGLDMTVRGPEERSMRKSIDTFSVLGPWLVTADEIDDPAGLALELTVNGEFRQEANTRDLVLTLPELIEWASRYYTLEPGDVIFTGTPEGVAEVKASDRIRATIEKIGSLEVEVTNA